jgi:hypothetical protein
MIGLENEKCCLTGTKKRASPTLLQTVSTIGKQFSTNG